MLFRVFLIPRTFALFMAILCFGVEELHAAVDGPVTVVVSGNTSQNKKRRIEKALNEALGNAGLELAVLKRAQRRRLIQWMRRCLDRESAKCRKRLSKLSLQSSLLVARAEGRAIEVLWIAPGREGVDREMGPPGSINAPGVWKELVGSLIAKVGQEAQSDVVQISAEREESESPKKESTEVEGVGALALEAVPEAPPSPETNALVELSPLPDSSSETQSSEEPGEVAIRESKQEPASSQAKEGLGGVEPPAEEEWEMSTYDPEVLQAEARLAEFDGQPDQALAFLRKAHAITPEDTTVTFDLARVSFESNSPQMAEDAAALLAMEREHAEPRLLASYILSRLGRREEAAIELHAAEELRAKAGEGTGLRQAVAAATPPRTIPLFGASLRLGVQADSNISVLPEDAPSHDQGFRGLVAGSVILRPGSAKSGVDIGGDFSLLPHLNDRARLDTYDVGSVRVSLSPYTRAGQWRIRGRAWGAMTLIDAFSTRFMQEAAASLTALRKVRRWTLGAYAQTGFRDFVGAGDTENPEGQDGDRDGLKVEAGFTSRGRLGRVSASFRLGYQSELAQGVAQREQGTVLSTSASIPLAKGFRLMAALQHVWRHYGEGREPSGVGAPRRDRIEHRITPSLSMRYAVNKNMAFLASYAFTKNLSNSDFEYNRQMGTLAMEATW